MKKYLLRMDYLIKNRFLLFLLFLIATIAYPMFANGARNMELLSTILYSGIILSGMYAFHNERKFLLISSTFFIIAITLEWLQFFTDSPLLNSIQPLTTSIVLILLLVLTFKSLLLAKQVDHNVIFGVVSFSQKYFAANKGDPPLMIPPIVSLT